MLFLFNRQREFQLPDSPVAVMFSGGKDSTLLLQLVAEAQLALPSRKRKPVAVVSADTLVENPLYAHYFYRKFQQIQQFAAEANLPWSFHLVTPPPDKTFFTLMIGRGYPAPTKDFRWCTDRLKNSPLNQLVKELAHRHRGLKVLVGARKDESVTRRRSIEKWEQMDEKIPKLRPIADWTTEEVWNYLRENPAPWGSHRELFQLYLEGSDPGCTPIQLGCRKECSPRFGCWTCSVVKRDRSMENYATRYQWLQPLLEFRNWIVQVREDPANRWPHRRDGRKGPGPLKLEVRKAILERLLEIERELQPQLKELFREVGQVPSFLKEGRLISDEELEVIARFWSRERGGEELRELLANFNRTLPKRGKFLKPEEEREVKEWGVDPFQLELLLEVVAGRRKYKRGYWSQLEEVVFQSWEPMEGSTAGNLLK